MTDYTKERWHVGGNGTVVYDRNGIPVASTVVTQDLMQTGTAMGNGKRIVACVNACADVSNGELALTSVSVLLGLLEKTEFQRDALLESLERMVEYHVPKINPLSDAAELSAKATIAAVKG